MQLPEVARLNSAGELSVDNVDVFCEKGVFDVDQTRRILEAGKAAGMRINFHAEELSCLGGAEVSAENLSEPLLQLGLLRKEESKGCHSQEAAISFWPNSIFPIDDSGRPVTLSVTGKTTFRFFNNECLPWYAYVRS